MQAFSADSPPPKPAHLTRRRFLTTAVAATASLALYSDEIARHELELTHRTFYLRNLPPAFDGFRIVQFSDIHLAEYTEDFFLRRVIARVNALAPDLLLITGDYISHGPLAYSVSRAAAHRCAELLSTLNCPLRFGVLGNHDLFLGHYFVRDLLEAQGLPILVNQSVPIERSGQHILLAGLDDVSEGYPNLTLAMPANPGVPVILLVHEPDYANHVIAQPRGRFVDLILSGHTHGGQVRLPGLPPLTLPPLGQRYPEGHYVIGGTQLYVNRGIGTVGIPFRLNCPPEITVATLKPAISLSF